MANAEQAAPAGAEPSEPSKKAPPSPPGLTRRELAEKLGVHMMTVTKWEADGMPVFERGRRGKPSYYKIRSVRAWVQKREKAAKANGGVDVAQERARKERAQAAIAEQLFQERARNLLSREETERQWEDHVKARRDMVLRLAQLWASGAYEAGQREGVPGVERFLDGKFETLLREWAAPDLPEAQAS